MTARLLIVIVILISGCIPCPAQQLSAEAIWDPVATFIEIDGYIVRWGTNTIQTPISASPYCFVPFAPSSRLATAYTVTCFTNDPFPLVTCHTNHAGTVTCVTNSITESAPSTVFLDYTTNLDMFLTIAGGNAILTVYGAEFTHYQIFGGSTPALDAMTNLIGETDGTNGLFYCTNAMTNSQQFYLLVPAATPG